MAGSGKGKHKKGKKQSKSKNDSVNRQPETSKSDNVSMVKKPEDENLHGEFKLKMDVSGWEKKNERALELLLYNKFEWTYTEALQHLVNLGYDSYIARKAILMNGHMHGRTSLLSNIVDNSVEYIQSKGVITDKEAPQGYQHMTDRINSLMKALIMEMQKLYHNCDKAVAMKQLLGIGAASSSCSTRLQSEVCSKGESSAGDSTEYTTENEARDCDPGAAEDIEATEPEDISLPEELKASPAYPCDLTYDDHPDDWEDSCLLQLQEETPEDPKDLLLSCMLKMYRELKEEVKERREWALQRAAQADQKLNNHLSELKRLRQENLELQKIKADGKKVLKRNLKKQREMDISLLNALSQVERSTAAVRQLELENEVLMEDIERYTLDASKVNKTLRGAEKRERKFLKRAEAMEEEKSLLQRQVEEEKQKLVQLNGELLELNKALEVAEAKLVEEKKEKEVAFAVLAEEERLKNIAEANLRSAQASLRQRLETNRQLLKDDMCRLEEELAKLQICPDEIFEAIPPEYILLDSPEEAPSHRQCIICSTKDANVVFLPCAHQVVCSKCNEGTSCPVCHVHIDKRVTINGANS